MISHSHDGSTMIDDDSGVATLRRGGERTERLVQT
jgi:hypothetical protein